MRLTTPLDLPAPGRHQALYIILRFQQSPKFLLNSHEAQFTATLSQCIATPILGHSFFRSYGASLPSSLTMVISRALGFSPHPPVSVYGTSFSFTPLVGFPGTGWNRSRLGRSPPEVKSLRLMIWGFATISPYAPSVASISHLVLSDASPHQFNASEKVEDY